MELSPQFDYSRPSANAALWPVYWKEVAEHGFTFYSVYGKDTETPSAFRIAPKARLVGSMNTRRFSETVSYLQVTHQQEVLVFLIEGNNSVSVSIAGRNREALDDARKIIDTVYPSIEDQENKTRVNFWYHVDHNGPTYYARAMEFPKWSDIEKNYMPVVQQELNRLLQGFVPSYGGQLLIWNGEPGTGKTTALRALVENWSQWCSVEFITDPEVFFNNPSYMMQVFLNQEFYSDGEVDTEGELLASKSPRKWKLVILEDAGDLISADARIKTGQAFSRLNNVVDGLLGQSLNVLVLITTNEELKDLNKAIARAGRTASKLSFPVFDTETANQWLKDQHCVEEVTQSISLAELYAKLNGFQNQRQEGRNPNIGFRTA